MSPYRTLKSRNVQMVELSRSVFISIQKCRRSLPKIDGCRFSGLFTRFYLGWLSRFHAVNVVFWWSSKVKYRISCTPAFGHLHVDVMTHDRFGWCFFFAISQRGYNLISETHFYNRLCHKPRSNLWNDKRVLLEFYSVESANDRNKKVEIQQRSGIWLLKMLCLLTFVVFYGVRAQLIDNWKLKY